MREVLFRGKRIDNGEWVYGYLIAPEFAPNKKYIGHLFAEDDHDIDVVEVDPETIGQYTGLKDRHGNKIFEGDILCFIDIDYITQIYYGVVKFGIYNSSAHDVNNQGFYVDWQGVQYRNDLGYWANQSYCYVAGSIHDNPELMEVKQNDD